MGRHTIQSKREKRRKQKKKHRSIEIEGTPSHSSEPTSSCLPEQAKYNTTDDFYAALDRIGDENIKYWEEHRDSMESFKDVHPAVVCDAKNSVEVYVRGAYKGMAGLNRVSIEHYFKTMHEKEQKAQHLCKSLRNRIEELESELEESKVKIEMVKRDSLKNAEQGRQFWRNEIFEEATLGGRMVMTSIRKTGV